MKKSLVLAAAAAALGFAAPAFAQMPSVGPVSYYGNLGYSSFNGIGGVDPDFQGVTARLGARFGQYFGVEGEGTAGFNSDHLDLAGTHANVRLTDEYAGYAVGYVPLAPNADLLARIGYGATNFHATAPGVSQGSTDNSWNFGAGAQYFFTHSDGLRADYTYYDYNTGPNANVWSVAWVHKF